jgi:hypothetical protein
MHIEHGLWAAKMLVRGLLGSYLTRKRSEVQILQRPPGKSSHMDYARDALFQPWTAIWSNAGMFICWSYL